MAISEKMSPEEVAAARSESSAGSFGNVIGKVNDFISSPIGSIAGGLLGGIAGLFKKKKSAAELAAESARAVNAADDPYYYDKNTINYGNWLGAQQNWGLPGAGNFLQGNPQQAEALARNFGDLAPDWQSRTPAGMSYDDMRRNIGQQTYAKLAGPRMEQMRPMFSEGGFGAGGGNFGDYHSGSAPLMLNQGTRFSTMIPGV